MHDSPKTIETTALVTETPASVHIERAPDLFIPAVDVANVESAARMEAEEHPRPATGMAACANEACRQFFWPRSKSGGRPQKYCSEACRRAADAERKANASNAGQRAATQSGRPYPDSQKHAEIAQEPADDDAWFIDHRDAVVIEDQRSIAIYTNEADAIVIRQERGWYQQHDAVITIRAEHLPDLIDRLCDLAGIGGAGCPEGGA